MKRFFIYGWKTVFKLFLGGAGAGAFAMSANACGRVDKAVYTLDFLGYGIAEFFER